ncbi:MAG: pilus assembly protein PilM [Candidatus Omnitrophota bacterium]
MIILSLYITDTAIKSVWLRRNRTKINALKQQSISRELAPSAIKKIIFAPGYHPDKVLLCLPRRKLSFKTIIIPAIEKAEINQILPFELNNIIPYRLDNCCYDWFLLEVSPEGYSKIQVVIVRKKIVTEYLEFCKNIGCDVQIIGVSTLALFESFKQSIKSHPERNVKGCVVLQVEENFVDMIVIHNMEMVVSREIAFKNTEGLMAEVDKNLQVGQIINKEFELELIILNDTTTTAANLVEILAKRFKVNIEIDNSIDFSAGMAMATDIINLLPEDERRIRYLKQLKQGLFLFAIILIFIALLAVFLSFLKFKKQEWNIAELDKMLQQLEISSKDLESKKQRLELIIQQRGIYPRVVLDVLTRLGNQTGEGIVFNSFIIDENKNIILRGEANLYDQFLNYVSILDKSDYFQDVEVKYTSRRQLKDKTLTSFELALRLKE